MKASTARAGHTLHRWRTGDRGNLKKYFVRFLGNGTFLTEPHPALLEKIIRLKGEGETIDVFKADLLIESEYPEELEKQWHKVLSKVKFIE